MDNLKLTCFFMEFQDSFEDKRSKILMILCASPDPKELHKTISTLEYGARAKCITRAAHASTPRDKVSSKEAQNAIQLKDEELARLRTKLSLVEAREAAAKEEVIRVAEETQFLWGELRTTEDKMLMQQQELLATKQRLQEVEREKLCMDE
jgi:kinesin family protein 3/17/kinesin family protein 11